MSFRDEAKKLAYQAGGSFKTIEGRQLAVGRFADYLKAANLQVRGVEFLKGKHVQGFVETRKEAGVGLRTIQNEITALRTILRAAGREKLADQISTKALGIAGACRDGTKTALAQSRLVELRTAVLARDEGVGAVVDLQRALGLRAEEGVKACKSLATWERQLKAGQPLRVIFGTKGGRPRDVMPADRERALAAIQSAKALADRQGGVLVAKPNEKEAMTRYRNVMAAAGFTGKESGHSLRYAFAQEQIRAYTLTGYSQKEALALASMDLGHGDGRGRYVAQVYAR